MSESKDVAQTIDLPPDDLATAICKGYAAAWQQALEDGASPPVLDAFLDQVVDADRNRVSEQLQAIERRHLPMWQARQTSEDSLDGASMPTENVTVAPDFAANATQGPSGNTP